MFLNNKGTLSHNHNVINKIKSKLMVMCVCSLNNVIVYGDDGSLATGSFRNTGPSFLRSTSMFIITMFAIAIMPNLNINVSST